MYDGFKLAPYLREYVELSLSKSLSSIGFENNLIQDLFKCLDDFDFENFKNNHAQQLDAVHEINFYQKILPDFYEKYVIPYIPKSNLVLDIGCGNGVLAKTISASLKFKRVLGVDIVKYVEWELFKNDKVSYDVLEENSFYEYISLNKPDAVVLTWTLHHMPFDEQISYISRMSELLKKEATIVVLEDSYSEKMIPEVGQNEQALFMRLSPEDRQTAMSVLDWISNRVLSRTRTCPVTFTYRTLESWKDLFKKMDFDIVESRYIGFPLPKNINEPQGLLVLRVNKQL